MKRRSAKKRSTKKVGKKIERPSRRISQVREDTAQRRKYAGGGRVEAYTFGEALSGKRWP